MTPDFREIPKYTGVLKARNLEIFQQRLKDANMLDLSHDFMRASGALAAICQREDIEAALRTPGLRRLSTGSTFRISPARARRWWGC